MYVRTYVSSSILVAAMHTYYVHSHYEYPEFGVATYFVNKSCNTI